MYRYIKMTSYGEYIRLLAYMIYKRLKLVVQRCQCVVNYWQPKLESKLKGTKLKPKALKL
jgi:hypothetical protein